MPILKQNLVLITQMVFFTILALPLSHADTIQEPEKAPSLGFKDPMQMDFINLSKEQSLAIDKIRKAWNQEYAEMLEEELGTRKYRKSFSKFQTKCRAILSDEQLMMWRRFNLITNFGPSEISLIDRAIKIGDPKFSTSQLRHLRYIRKSWIELVDAQLSDKPNSTREQENELLASLVEAQGERIRSKMFDVLTPEQTKRFSQLEWQKSVTRYGVFAFGGDENAAELKFNDQQKQQLQKLIVEIENLPSKYEAVKKSLESYITFFNSLPDDQKNIWRNKLGAPAKLTNVNWLSNFMKEDLASLKSTQDKK